MKIAEAALSHGEMFTLLQRYEALVEVMLASNNTLITRLAAETDLGEDAARLLNDWSAFNTSLQALHACEVTKVAAQPPTARVN